MQWDPEKDTFEYMGVVWHPTNIESSSRGPDRNHEMKITFIGFKPVPSSYQPKEEPTMNRSTTVFLVDNTVKAIRARYEEGGKEEVFKTFDDTIKKDDILVVESGTRHGFTTVKVTETDVIVDIEDNTVQVKWVITKVDMTDHKSILEQEAAAIDKVRAAEFNKKKRDLMANMASPEDADALKAISVNPAIAAPKASEPFSNQKT